jgi:hypothetical protein
MNDIITESRIVFGSLEKWTALYEINQQLPAIIDHWLTSGAVALRKDFEAKPCQEWKCSDWGSKRDSRWYLADLGWDSVGFGFGWGEFEFHLHLETGGSHDWQKAIALIAKPEFEPLLSIFEARYSNTPHRSRDGSLCSDRCFNPFSDTQDPNLRRHIIAWHAIHDQASFIEKMSNKVRQITGDPSISGLIRKLSLQSKRAPAS